MNFQYSDNQIMLRNLAERFMADHYDLERRRTYQRSPEGYSADNWQQLAELGFLAVPLPEDEGGFDGGSIECIATMEAFGYGLMTEPVLLDVWLTLPLLSRSSHALVTDTILPTIKDGRCRVALAHFEPRTTTMTDDMTVRSHTDRNGVIHLSGIKSPVIAPRGADYLLVSAISGGNDTPSFYLLDSNNENIAWQHLRLVDGSVAARIRLRNAKPRAKLDLARTDLDVAMDLARLGACAETLGIMERLFQDTCNHARSRRQFGQPIARFQAIQHRMAELYVDLELSRSLLYRAALLDDSPAERRRAIAGASAYIGQRGVNLGEACVHIHGGMGVSDELPIGHGLKRLLLVNNLFGTAGEELERYMSAA